MKKNILTIVVGAVLGIVLSLGMTQVVIGQPSTNTVAAPSGEVMTLPVVPPDSGIGTSPTVAETQTGIGTSPKDPVKDPGGAAGQVKDAFGSGMYTLTIILVMLGMAKLFLAAAERWNLGKLEKATPYLIGSLGLLTAASTSLMATGSLDWRALVGALATTASLHLNMPKKANSEP